MVAVNCYEHGDICRDVGNSHHTLACSLCLEELSSTFSSPVEVFCPAEQRLAGCFRDNFLLYFSIKSVLNAFLFSLLDSLLEAVRDFERSWYHIEVES